jgi:hypothetical protein
VDTASGSPLTVMADTAGNIERDVMNTKYNYAVKAGQDLSQANIWDMKGQQAESQGSSALWGGLLGGAAAAFKGAADLFGPDPLSKKAGSGAGEGLNYGGYGKGITSGIRLSY